VGPTLGTDIALGVNTSLQGDLLPELLRFGRITERQLHASDLGALIVEMLSPALHHAGAEVEEILIRPPGGPLPYGVSVDDIVAVIGGFTGPAAE
jgi:hypothetical protein